MKYLVVWSGGYEETNFYGSDSESAAVLKYEEWCEHQVDGDMVYLVDVSGKNVIVLESTS